jgi:hypothetical protein
MLNVSKEQAIVTQAAVAPAFFLLHLLRVNTLLAIRIAGCSLIVLDSAS